MTVNGKKSPLRGDQRKNRNIDRNMILQRLLHDVEWLEQQAQKKHCVKTPKLNAMRGAIYGYSVMLRALSDIELELRVEELEKKLENGVVIPNEKKPA